MIAAYKLPGNVLASIFMLTFLGSLPATSLAYDPTNAVNIQNDLKARTEGVGVDEHLGAQLNPDWSFVSDRGQNVRLGDYFKGDKPILLTTVYYTCPGLCNLHLNGLIKVMKDMDYVAGRDFKFLAVSIHPGETPEVAQAKRLNYLDEYGRNEGADGWDFLTGDQAAIAGITGEVGFRYKWLEVEEQYSHPAVAYILTPEGKISRYLYGMEFASQDLKLALLEAGRGQIGTLVEQLLLFCYQFDPSKNKYTLYSFRIMQLGALLTLLILGIVLVPMWIRERRKVAAA